MSDCERPIVRDSIALVPHMLTDAECRALIAAAEDSSAVADAEDDEGVASTARLQRLQLCNMNEEAKGLSNRILTEMVVPFLEREMPQAAYCLFEECQGKANLHQMNFSFSEYEPTVNKYVHGGDFEPHNDGYELTVIIPLNDEFEGGGTLFWAEGEHAGQQCPGSCGIRIDAPQGMAVLFNGNIRHAGKPVSQGVRYVYVASFSLTPYPSE